MRSLACFVILAFYAGELSGQVESRTKRKIQFSFISGFGTNGIQPGNFSNGVSINLTSGYSAAGLIFEFATISNLNTDYTRGLQIAGIANLTGVNAFGGLSKKAVDAKLKSGFSSSLKGVQISSLLNLVVDEGNGAQFTGGVNIVKKALIGAQFSTISNFVYQYTFGTQISGLFNVSVASIDGVQISSLLNFTKGELNGLQLGMLNLAGSIEGKNSANKTHDGGIQLGIWNIATKMNGFQVGLINYGQRSQGTQIGLINIFKRGTQPETRDGTAIGLLNLGGVNYFSVYSNEIFGFNSEISTGIKKNARIRADRNTVYVTNALIYSNNPYKNEAWGLGYGLKKMFFNRSSVPSLSESKFFSLGMDFQHINLKKGEFTNALSLLTRLKFEAGKRFVPKSYGINWYGSVSLNTYWGEYADLIAPDIFSSKSKMSDTKIAFWVGYSVGVIIH